MPTPDLNRYPTRCSQVTAHLPKGYELIRGTGYFYFIGDGEHGDAIGAWPSSSVYTYRISNLTIAEWIHEFAQLAAAARGLAH